MSEERRRRLPGRACGKTFLRPGAFRKYYRLQHRSDFRRGGRPQSRGRQHLRDCSCRRDRLEHRRSLARENRCRLSSLQPSKDHRIRRRRSSRSDEIRSLSGGKANLDVDLRRDGGLVSSLASSTVVGDVEQCYRNHPYARPRQRPPPLAQCCQPHGFPNGPSPERHRRIRFLREGRPSRFRRRGSLWPGPQDEKERSHREGRTTSRSWSRMALRRCAQRIRGLRDIEHFVHRAAESDHPAELGLPR